LFGLKASFKGVHCKQSFHEISSIFLRAFLFLTVFLKQLHQTTRPAPFPTLAFLFYFLYDLVLVLQLEMELADFFLEMHRQQLAGVVFVLYHRRALLLLTVFLGD
jgi:hypothetical protein